jgi:Fe-S cluster assembly scaffold protein SufB
MPVQACMFLKSERFTQKVHNIVIIEEGASMYMITGCSSARSATEGFHLGITEFFVKKGGYLNTTMIHSWKEDITVRPVSIAVVEEGGTFVSNYVSLRPVRDILMYPTALLRGSGARASMNSLVLSFPDTRQDIGSRVIFTAPGTQAEIVSRVVSLGGTNISRGHLKADAENVRAHLECRGLILSKKGTISAIPELETAYRDVDMSHEAAVGRISQEEIEYLASRGMTYNEAQSVIIRGFMDVNILGLPEALRKDIASLEEKMLKASL